MKGRWNGHINNMIMAEIPKLYMAGFSRHHVEVGIPDIAMGNAAVYSIS